MSSNPGGGAMALSRTISTLGGEARLPKDRFSETVVADLGKRFLLNSCAWSGFHFHFTLGNPPWLLTPFLSRLL